jgi:hypothetical protein
MYSWILHGLNLPGKLKCGRLHRVAWPGQMLDARAGGRDHMSCSDHAQLAIIYKFGCHDESKEDCDAVYAAVYIYTATQI